MRLAPRDQPMLPSLRVAPGPPHPQGGRGSFCSSYSSGFNSSQLFDDSDGREGDVDDVDSTRVAATTRCCRCPSRW
ncbi:hypothetical protein PF003_g23492 [Phytophthora fragariae]|nr:hypothetical protein PF003_g23492 [Phytophthora fragariae]